ncbi:MbtH family protein [Actinophytocola sp.]|uniref:MbtH family protein n=1 Tax=Actinophytocola sp. TaxID=1872138 RepID=UPI002ED5C4D2
MTNPFDREDGQFYVLKNSEGQYSIWPDFAPVPAGWDIVMEPASKVTCLAHIEEEWTDLRPQSAR